MPAPQVRDLYTASQVAAFCQVDLKTIHNWSDRGEIRHFRTPGRHLRFKQADLVDFMQRFGYPVPDDLFAGRRRVHVIDDDGAWLKQLQRSLGKAFVVAGFDDAFDGLVAIGADVPDAIVLDIKMPGFDGYRCLARLHEMPATRKIKTVVCSGHADARKKSLDAGAAAFVLKPDIDALRATLEELLGVEPAHALG